MRLFQHSQTISSGQVALAALILSVAATPANAQTVTGVRVVASSIEGEPLAGALIAFVDRNGNVAAEALLNAQGERALSAPAGTYKVRVRRIGYEPFVSEEFTIPRESVLNLAVPVRRVALQTVIVTSESACRRNDAQQQGIGVLWEEISKALVSTQLSRRDFGDATWVVTYEKQVKNKRVIRGDTAVKLLGLRPFVAVNPDSLARTGYVRGNIVTGWQYFAPDEAVLLSRSFADTHCFRVERDRKRSGQVGLSFDPQPGREVPDIAGVLWLDEKSGELREMFFTYVNLAEVERFKPGGYVRFRRIPPGIWVVDDWKLRFPFLELSFDRRALTEVGYTEHGGSILRK